MGRAGILELLEGTLTRKAKKGAFCGLLLGRGDLRGNSIHANNPEPHYEHNSHPLAMFTLPIKVWVAINVFKFTCLPLTVGEGQLQKPKVLKITGVMKPHQSEPSLYPGAGPRRSWARGKREGASRS